MPVAAPRRLLLVRTDWLGETVLNLPLADALKAAYPQTHLTWMASPMAAPLLTVSAADAIITDPADPSAPWWRQVPALFSCFLKGRWDAIVVSNPRKAVHLAAQLARIPMRVGYDRKAGLCLTHRLDTSNALGQMHEVDYNLQLLRAFGLMPPPAPALVLPVDPAADREFAHDWSAQLGLSAGLIAVHPWASKPKKQWRLDRARELVRGLAQQGFRVVLIGGPTERPAAERWRATLSVPTVDTTGRLTLPQLAACLRRMDLLVSTDSGPMHIAAAVGVPTVALFGTTEPAASPRRWGPWGPGHTVIHRASMDAITIEDVLQACHPTLASIAA